MVRERTVSPELGDKVDRYLIEGRCNIQIPPEGITARFRGEHGWWTTRLFPDGKGSCECPAFEYGRPCVHTLVLQRVAEL